MDVVEYFKMAKNFIDFIKEKKRMARIENKNEMILVQWQTCVEMANSISQRRDAMNNIFITLNLAIMTAVSVVWNIRSIVILVAGVAICVLWIILIRNYKQLNSVKFKIINSII